MMLKTCSTCKERKVLSPDGTWGSDLIEARWRG